MSEKQCHRLADFDANDWNEVEKAFASAEVLPMGQHWNSENEDGFRDAEVRTGWTPEGLWAYAKLQDDDIFNDADGPNQFTWTLGDVFEIFVQAERGGKYYEIHVTPENYDSQMYWENEEAITALRAMDSNQARDATADYMVRLPKFESHTLREDNAWRALAFFPADALYPGNLSVGDTIRYSFCRYDVTRNADGTYGTEIISSTSPHEEANFHLVADYQTLVFVD